MMRKAPIILFLLAAFIMTSAMGEKGSGFTRAPRVEKNFNVSVTDLNGRKIDGERFSWEGRIHFSGFLGMAQVTVPFERVKELNLGDKKDRNIKAIAKLKDGTEAAIDIEADSRCFGEAGFGSFMLKMSEIRSVVFR